MGHGARQHGLAALAGRRHLPLGVRPQAGEPQPPHGPPRGAPSAAHLAARTRPPGTSERAQHK